MTPENSVMPCPFDVAIKKLGAPDEATGHWMLDEGNLRWFVEQCTRASTPAPDVKAAWERIKAEGDWLLADIATIERALTAQQPGKGLTEAEIKQEVEDLLTAMTTQILRYMRSQISRDKCEAKMREMLVELIQKARGK